MKKLMNILLLSCKKASGLIEKKLHFPLNPVEKIQLAIHTSMCDACKKHQHQIIELDAMLKDHISSDTTFKDTSSEKLSDIFKSQLIKKIEEKE